MSPLGAGAARLPVTRLDSLLWQGVTDGVFPSARAEVWKEGTLAWRGGTCPEHTAFDLASITKVMVTTAMLLELHRGGRLSLEQPLGQLLPGVAIKEATLLDLLFHRAGLPAFRPLFAPALQRHPELSEPACPPGTRFRVRAEVLAAAATVSGEAPRGTQAVYSDLGFILLGAALERVLSEELDSLFDQLVRRPLGLTAAFRRVSSNLPLPESIADTGKTRPREPAPGQEGLWTLPAAPARPGEVDDDNAWVLDGVAGHAGLFGTAADVARFGQAVLEGDCFAPPTPWGRDASTPQSTRALGFDTPSSVDPSCGPRFGKAGPRGAIGHLGFTGTSLWIDFDRSMVVVLLTNRVALGRANLKLRDFRPRFHEAVLDALEGSG